MNYLKLTIEGGSADVRKIIFGGASPDMRTVVDLIGRRFCISEFSENISVDPWPVPTNWPKTIGPNWKTV